MIADGIYLSLGVIPILIGPMQVLLAILPAIGVALLGILASLLKPAMMLAALKVAWRNKVAVSAVLLICVGLVYGYQHLPSFGRAAAFAGTAEWPMFRGGLSRRGAQADGKEDPLAGGQVWDPAGSRS